MRQRAETHTQRHSALTAIFAQQLAMILRATWQGGTPPLPLTEPGDRRTGDKCRMVTLPATAPPALERTPASPTIFYIFDW